MPIGKYWMGVNYYSNKNYKFVKEKPAFLIKTLNSTNVMFAVIMYNYQTM